MQHAVGSPLPPPHQWGHGPVGWSPAAQHSGPYPSQPSPPHPQAQPAPGFTPPQVPQPQVPPVPPAPPNAHPPAVHPPAPHPAAPRPPVPPAGHPQGMPVPPPQYSPPPRQTPGDVTGHVPLPPGEPVAAPAPAVPDPATTMLAVLLIGPAGAGKTSVAKYWADHRRTPTAHISLDDVREWVRSGFADPQRGWNDHSEAQYRLARRTCGFAARNFLANGISCILDDAIFPDRPAVGLGGWKRHVGPGLLPVVLLPGLEVVLERNAERSGNRRLTDEEVARIHGRMAGWYGSGLPIIDNSQLDVESTARVLDEVLARAIASPPKW
ncbi:AAA family ATPase [Streptomyces niveiscabiei]|uniref:AAA family ATPase n=1 Tax=Streptomyces niveiscabiei TaxID=164115 RepID=A0ABW9I1P1_9ACTN